MNDEIVTEEPLTEAEIRAVEMGECGCQCARLVAEVRRLQVRVREHGHELEEARRNDRDTRGHLSAATHNLVKAREERDQARRDNGAITIETGREIERLATERDAANATREVIANNLTNALQRAERAETQIGELEVRMSGMQRVTVQHSDEELVLEYLDRCRKGDTAGVIAAILRRLGAVELDAILKGGQLAALDERLRALEKI